MSRWQLLLGVSVLTGCAEAPEARERATMTKAEELYRKGTGLLERNPELAITHLSESLELQPDAPPAIYNRAVAFARVGRDAEAVADIERLEKIAPEVGRALRDEMKSTAEPYSDLGNRAFEAGNFEQAIAKYDSALAYNPEYGNAWVGKGLALKELGRTDQAMACYDRAAEVEPENYYVYINRAELYREQNRRKEALADYTRAIALSPDKPDPYLGRSELYSDLGMIEESRSDLEKAQQLGSRTDTE